MAAGLHLEIVGAVPNGVDAPLLQRAAQAVAGCVPLQANGTINLKLVDDAEITALNKQYSGNAYATDVLSFSYIEDGGLAIGEDVGDIAISYETAGTQADAAGTDLATEVALLTVHGVLHVLGYDHQTAEEQERINKLQADILSQLGLPYRDFNWHE